MKSKMYRILSLCLMAVGLLLIASAVALAWAATLEMDVIGGAGWPTFQWILRHRQGGLYGYTVLGGVILLAAGVAVALWKKPFGR